MLCAITKLQILLYLYLTRALPIDPVSSTDLVRCEGEKVLRTKRVMKYLKMKIINLFLISR